MGRRARMLAEALAALQAQDGLELGAASSVYETDPVGVTEQPAFLNMVARFRCTLTPAGLLEAVRSVEAKRGRVRTMRWGPRTIDVDVLLIGGLRVQTDELTVPHPELTRRQFVLIPLAEIDPGLPLPGPGTAGARTAGELAEPGGQAVRRLGTLDELLRREKR